MTDYTSALNTVADSFLEATNFTYSECEAGVTQLDQIIVGSPSSRSDIARGYLLPMIYAYWERFFKIVLAEYLQSLSRVTIKFDELRLSVARHRVRRELVALCDILHIQGLHELPDKLSMAELSTFAAALKAWVDGPVVFPDPSNWIETRSNVKYNVVEDNFRKLGLSIERLKAHMKPNPPIIVGLRDLVDARNQIAHGATFQPIDASVWEKHKTFVLELMNAMQLELFETLRDQTRITELQAANSPVPLSSVFGSAIAHAANQAREN